MISLILSGGVGSRLWPLSREKLPKQFSPIFSQSLFTRTALRLSRLGDVQVCTSRSLKEITETENRNQRLGLHHLYFEPMGKNTAPAVALVCRALELRGQDQELMGVFPADHWIEKEDQFFAVMDLAQKCARQEQVVTIGITPHYPATGFGYVHCNKEAYLKDQAFTAYKVHGFREKPDLATAEKYIAEKNYFWNSGMFVFKVQTMIDAMRTHMPAMWSAMEKIVLNSEGDLNPHSVETAYDLLDSQSLDYGIMEKITNQVNIPCDIGWSDLGSWDDIANLHGDSAPQTQVFQSDSKGCYAYSLNPKAVCFLNVSDLMVVDTEDVVLVTRKGESQNVKKLYDQLKSQEHHLIRDHQFEYRPWGYYRNLYEEPHFKSKVITVAPHQQLSYQSHAQRAEVWVIVEGQGEVVLNDSTLEVQVGQVIQIATGTKHRIRNTEDMPLKFVEVQLGQYFGEDDIVRYQDDYHRR